MAKHEAIRGKKSAKGEGEPVKVAITHKRLREELTELGTLIGNVESILHSSATKEERDLLGQMQGLVDAAIKQVAKIPCPNPMYNILTVDRDRLSELN